MAGSPRLAMHGIVRRFPGVVALDSVDLEVAAGEVHVLAGENGAGKSTLMRILAGAERRDEGSVTIDGEEATLASPAEALARGISVVYQDLALCPDLTVAENLFLGREPLRRPRLLGRVDGDVQRREARRLLGEIGATIDPDRRCGALTLAERQLVEIARALARDARILVLDEPTASLAEGEIRALFAVVRRLRERGAAIVYISHRLEEYAAVGDRVTVLRAGQVTLRAPIGEANAPTLVRAMAGREVGELFPRLERSRGARLLRIVGLSGDGTGRRSPRGVSVDLHAGEIVGVAGLMGSGRSAFLRALFGLEPAAEGRLELAQGAPRPPFRSPREAIAAGLGYCPEERRQRGLCLDLSATANLTLASLDAVMGRAGLLEPSRERLFAQPIAGELGLREAALDRPVRGLSGGNQQKVVLGRWLLRGASVLLLDEPTRGIDVGSKAEIFRRMAAWAAEGRALLFVSSHLPELLGVADRILVLHRGRLVADRPARDLTEEQALHLASTGEDALAA